MLRNNLSKLLIAGVMVGSVMVYVSQHSAAQSANLSEVSVTLSNSRPSFRGALASGNTVGSSQVIIETSAGSWPSTSTAQLVEGDILAIGNASTITSYTVTNVVNESTVNVTKNSGGGPLESGDTEAGDDVFATSSASLTVRLTTTNAIPNGAFRILIPAVSDNTEANNGVPDDGAFDFGASAPTVTCPTDLTGYDFVSGTASASAVTVGSTEYHAYECRYAGNGAIGTVFDGTTNGAFVISSVINPAPKKGNHTAGTADTYRPIIQHLNSSYGVADFTTVSIGVVEAVRVTAEVAPQITFSINGVGNAQSACGLTTSVATTATSVPLGELAISSFINAAQRLYVSTNALNGYTVTAVANDQMGLGGTACAGADGTGLANCIQDPSGNNDMMTYDTSDEWTSTDKKGFGYSLQDVGNTTTEAFAYNESSRTFSARQFADASVTPTAEDPVTIFSDTTVADNDNLFVCYRAVIPATQAAGNYENYIVYTATASF